MKVAYGGVFPSVDMDGQQLTGNRALKAGAKLHGGPYALVSIRWEENTKNVFVSKLLTSWIMHHQGRLEMAPRKLVYETTLGLEGWNLLQVFCNRGKWTQCAA